VRLNANGSIDTTFRATNGTSGMMKQILPLSDGRVLLVADTNEAGLRERVSSIYLLNQDGSWIDGGLPIEANFGYYSYRLRVALRPDGRIYVSGNIRVLGQDATASNRIVRLNADCSLDKSFGVTRSSYSLVASMTVLPNGGLAVYGRNGNYNYSTGDYSDWGVVWYDEEGIEQRSRLLPKGGVESALVAQADGRLIVTGGNVFVDGQPRNRAFRLNTDGSLDRDFNVFDGPDQNLYLVNGAALLEPDGNIIFGGSFLAFQQQFRTGIARVNAAGLLDAGFKPELKKERPWGGERRGAERRGEKWSGVKRSGEERK
jgi:uncharacterized delta-60 repeat protein